MGLTSYQLYMKALLLYYTAMVCLWPELLLCKLDSQLSPFVDYLRSLGCSTSQLAEMLMLCPHLLGKHGAHFLSDHDMSFIA